jgi:hypothetical protein
MRSKSGLVLEGRTAGWRGSIVPNPAGKSATRVRFAKKPSSTEIDPDIIDWARAEAAQKLTWVLTLDVMRTNNGLRLEGDWDRGHVEWKEVMRGSDPPERTITVSNDRTPVHLQYQKEPCVAEERAIALEKPAALKTLDVSGQVADRLKPDKLSPGHGAYWFAELYYTITHEEVNSTGTLDHAGFLLHFIPVFYDLYKQNAEQFAAGRYDAIAPNWRKHFGDMPEGVTFPTDPEQLKLLDADLAQRVRESAVASAVLSLGVSAHIQGDMAPALADAYRSYARKYCGVPPFDDYHADFFEHNRPVFEAVSKSLLSQFGDALMLTPNREALEAAQKYFKAGLDLDEVFRWRQTAWDRARANLAQDVQ